MMTERELRILEETYGTPLYIFYEDAFKDNFLRLQSLFRSYYPKYYPAYSYKTNYTPEICRLVKQMGGYAEVVSDMEYAAAKKAGYPNQEIIFNGPFKGESLKVHLLHGGILNIDNRTELKEVFALADMFPEKTFCIGIRVNINIGQTFISRFGIDTDSGELDQAVRDIRGKKNIFLQGFHCHIGQSRTARAWELRTEKMLQLADRYFQEKPPEYLDLGSGMFSVMNAELAAQFGSDLPSYEDYAEVTVKRFAEHYKACSEHEKPVLFTEPGATVISGFIDFAGRVSSVKHIKGKTFVTMNCSSDNIGDICRLKKLPIHVFGEPGDYVENADIAGYTCLEHDILYRDFTGYIKEGNTILFENTGGYSNVSKPPFILPNCPMVAVDRKGKSRLIKRRETFGDIFCTYC